MQENTITIGAVRAAVAWILATVAVFGGTIALLFHHDDAALMCYAISMPVIGAACVLSIQCSLARMTKNLVNGIGLHEDSVKLRRLG